MPQCATVIPALTVHRQLDPGLPVLAEFAFCTLTATIIFLRINTNIKIQFLGDILNLKLNSFKF